MLGVHQPLLATAFSRAGTGRAACVHQVVSPRKRVENNLLDRTTLWTFASKLATVHHVAGQHGPLEFDFFIISSTSIPWANPETSRPT
jgi:hypothetical protein